MSEKVENLGKSLAVQLVYMSVDPDFIDCDP